MTRVLVRCDAGASIGLGHAGRALAVAEVLAERLGARPVFIARPDPLLTSFLAGRDVDFVALSGRGYEVDVVAAAAADGAVLVSDTYELDEDALDAVAGAGVRHLVVDDFARLRRWNCDALVNPNVGADASAYATRAAVGVGARYALLRREVRELARRRRETREEGDRVLVCLGGGSWRPAANGLLAELGELGAEVRATVDGSVPAGIVRVSPSRLPEQLAWADVGVVSGGVVKYEAAAAGLPMLLVAVVDHQRKVADRFAALGAAEYAGPLEEVSPADVAERVGSLLGRPAQRNQLTERARLLVDGRGAERAADLLLGADGG